MNYQTALYVDAALVILALCVIPFLKNREEKRPPIVVPENVAMARAGLSD
jgi:hypothetical protein